jgi:hypothetical protein
MIYLLIYWMGYMAGLGVVAGHYNKPVCELSKLDFIWNLVAWPLLVSLAFGRFLGKQIK